MWCGYRLAMKWCRIWSMRLAGSNRVRIRINRESVCDQEYTNLYLVLVFN